VRLSNALWALCLLLALIAVAYPPLMFAAGVVGLLALYHERDDTEGLNDGH
jgi:hypothetical protein